MGKVNGHYIEVSKNNEIKNFYITGDTVYNKVIINSVPNKNIDYIIVNLGQVMPQKKGGPITMSIDMLDRLSNKLNANKVIPVHIDDFSHYEMDKEDIVRSRYDLLERGEWVAI